MQRVRRVLGTLSLLSLLAGSSGAIASSILDNSNPGHVHHAHDHHQDANEHSAYLAQVNEHGYHPNALSRFEVQGLDSASMQHIALRFDIEYRIEDEGGDRFVVLLPPWKHDELHTLAPDAKLLDFEISSVLSDPDSDTRAPGYRDYDEVRSSFEGWAKDHPNLVKLIERPEMVSKNGKPFIVALLTKDVQKEHPKRPNVVITAATHGDEHLTTESLLLNVEKLIKGYNSNPRFKKMLDRVNLYIVPVVSPDSFLRSRRVHGMDPNRVYEYPGKTSPATKLTSANAMIKFYQDIEPAGVLDFHGAPPKGMIMCPWGYRKGKSIEDSKDRDFHLRVVKDMGKAAPSYKAGPIWSTIYVAPGNSTDHNYYRHKMLAIVIEIGGGDKSPPISKIPDKAKEVEEATWVFVEALVPDSDPEGGEGDGGDDEESSSSGGGEDEESSEGEESTGGEGSQSSEPSEEDETGEDSGDKPSQDPKSKNPDPSEQPEDSEPNGSQASNQAQDSSKPEPSNKGGCTLTATPSAPAVVGLLPALLLLRRRRRG